MKASDLFMVQFCAEHGSFRILPLRTCEDLAGVDMRQDRPHSWVVVDHAATEGAAYARMKAIRQTNCEFAVTRAKKNSDGLEGQSDV